MASMLRTKGWSVDYIMERAHFTRFIEAQAMAGQKFSLLRLLQIVADPDVGCVQLAR
jgi:hypothetical protein